MLGKHPKNKERLSWNNSQLVKYNPLIKIKVNKMAWEIGTTYQQIKEELHIEERLYERENSFMNHCGLRIQKDK